MNIFNKNWFWLILVLLIILEIAAIGWMKLGVSQNEVDSNTFGSASKSPARNENPTIQYYDRLIAPKNVFVDQPFIFELGINSKIITKPIYYINEQIWEKCSEREECRITLKKKGRYFLKICVEALKRCDTSSIVVLEPMENDSKTQDVVTDIEEVPVVFDDEPVDIPVRIKDEEEKEFNSNGKTGHTRCEDAEDNYVTTSCTFSFRPQQDIELKYVKLQSRKAAKVNVFIKSDDGTLNKTFNNRQILGNQLSEINFQSFDFVYRAGVMYTISISPVSGDSYELLNFESCNENSGNSVIKVVKSKTGGVIYELAYKY